MPHCIHAIKMRCVVMSMARSAASVWVDTLVTAKLETATVSTNSKHGGYFHRIMVCSVCKSNHFLFSRMVFTGHSSSFVFVHSFHIPCCFCHNTPECPLSAEMSCAAAVCMLYLYTCSAGFRIWTSIDYSRVQTIGGQRKCFYSEFRALSDHEKIDYSRVCRID